MVVVEEEEEPEGWWRPRVAGGWAGRSRGPGGCGARAAPLLWALSVGVVGGAEGACGLVVAASCRWKKSVLPFGPSPTVGEFVRWPNEVACAVQGRPPSPSGDQEPFARRTAHAHRVQQERVLAEWEGMCFCFGEMHTHSLPNVCVSTPAASLRAHMAQEGTHPPTQPYTTKRGNSDRAILRCFLPPPSSQCLVNSPSPLVATHTLPLPSTHPKRTHAHTYYTPTGRRSAGFPLTTTPSVRPTSITHAHPIPSHPPTYTERVKPWAGRPPRTLSLQSRATSPS